jgi:hypothetical protein
MNQETVRKSAFCALAGVALIGLAASSARADERMYPGPIAAIHIKLSDAATGDLRDLSALQSGQIRDLKAGASTCSSRSAGTRLAETLPSRRSSSPASPSSS